MDHDYVRRSMFVRRHHCERMIHEQTLGQHVSGVAILILHLLPDDYPVESKAKLLHAALVHDAAELSTGDVPWPAKSEFPDLESELKKAEASKANLVGMPVLLPHEKAILKWADMMEFYLTMVEEVAMGNRYARERMSTGYTLVREYANKIDSPNLRSRAILILEGA